MMEFERSLRDARVYLPSPPHARGGVHESCMGRAHDERRCMSPEKFHRQDGVWVLGSKSPCRSSTDNCCSRHEDDHHHHYDERRNNFNNSLTESKDLNHSSPVLLSNSHAANTSSLKRGRKLEHRHSTEEAPAPRGKSVSDRLFSSTTKSSAAKTKGYEPPKSSPQIKPRQSRSASFNRREKPKSLSRGRYGKDALKGQLSDDSAIGSGEDKQNVARTESSDSSISSISSGSKSPKPPYFDYEGSPTPPGKSPPILGSSLINFTDILEKKDPRSSVKSLDRISLINMNRMPSPTAKKSKPKETKPKPKVPEKKASTMNKPKTTPEIKKPAIQITRVGSLKKEHPKTSVGKPVKKVPPPVPKKPSLTFEDLPNQHKKLSRGKLREMVAGDDIGYLFVEFDYGSDVDSEAEPVYQIRRGDRPYEDLDDIISQGSVDLDDLVSE